MSWTRNWNESTPVGSTTQASDIDLWLRYLQVDNAERLESMFYGFNTSSSTAPEDAYGVKHLKLYPQTAPTGVTGFGFIYGKDASSVVELHWLGEPNATEVQITSGSNLNGAALLADSINATMIQFTNNTYLTQLDSGGTARNVAGIDDSDVTYLGDGDAHDVRLTDETASGDDDAHVSTKKYVDDQITTAAPTAKGWCKWASDGTIVAGSSNVTSVGKDSAGVYTVTWATDFGDTKYVPIPTILQASRISLATDIAAGSCKVRTYSLSSGVMIANDSAAGVVAFGTQ